jgi:hypothetical protein
MKKKEVFCSDCKYYLPGDIDIISDDIIDNCDYPSNRKYETIEKDYRSSGEQIHCGYKLHPKQLNMHNDCKWYKKC